MGNQEKRPGGKESISATKLCGGKIPSSANLQGRRVVVKFLSEEEPQLDRIEYHGNRSNNFEYRQHGLIEDISRSFKIDRVPNALGLLFLEYLYASLQDPPKLYVMEGKAGSPAASLANAFTKTNGSWYALFNEPSESGGPINRVSRIFGGSNWGSHSKGQKVVLIKSDFLPPDCVEVYLNDNLLELPEQIRDLVERYRKVWKFPSPTLRELPKKEESAPPVKPVEAPASKKESPKPKARKSKRPKLIRTALKKHKPRPKPEVTKPIAQPQSEPVVSPKDLFVKSNATGGEVSIEIKAPPETQFRPAPKKIDPNLFQIHNPQGHTWDDFEPLLNFGNDNSDADVWRIRDACEGVLIFGAVGSGKTSASGATIARAFLRAGFGGLVLTVKPDEAARWERLCRETGRECDFIHVTPTSGHKLNFLQYELQRPGERFALTDDLINLFRTLIDVMSRNKGERKNEEFWTNTTNQLMRKLIEVFLLAGEPVTLDRMVRFINRAPLDKDKDWRRTELFADVLRRAEVFATTKGNETDRGLFGDCFEYWTQTFPKVTDATRSGFITAFTSMADVLSGRGIHEMLCTETNLTPEMILSGKVVVLDIPLKGNIQGGLMVQAMFKLLYQQAVERRADKGKLTARPAFNWEDEGHMFFSQQDVNFQPTARDVRAPHVILSQNLHNFYQQGHNPHAVEAVFSAMNSLFFHTNGDMTTNRYASEKIGEIRKLKLTTDGLLRPMRDKDFTFLGREPEKVKNIGKFSLAEDRRSGLSPEDFAKLKRGGDGTCEAVLLWLSHQFAANGNRNFCVVKFAQEPR